MEKTLKEKVNIALDGPAGSGKSTVAKILAKKYDILYLDTGAMYRAFALGALRKGIDPADEKAAEKIAGEICVRVAYENGAQVTYLNDEDVSEEIRKNEVSAAASAIAVHKAVREKLVESQRKIAESMSCVLDGRDIGSYVLPHADFKFFVTADGRVRAKRRYSELLARGQEADEEEIYKQILERDERDSNRAFAPLKKADDATVVDTSDKTVEEVVEEISKSIDGRV